MSNIWALGVGPQCTIYNVHTIYIYIYTRKQAIHNQTTEEITLFICYFHTDRHNKTVTIISKIHVICNLIPQSFSRLPCNKTCRCVNYESHLTKSLSERSLAEHLFDIYMLIEEQIIKVYTITSYCSSFTTLIIGGYRLHIFNSSLYIVLHKLSSCIFLDRRFPIQLTN